MQCSIMKMSGSMTVAILLLGMLAGVSHSQSTNMTCVDEIVSGDDMLRECIGLMNSTMSVEDANADIEVLCSDVCLSKILQVYSDCGDSAAPETLILACSKDDQGRLCGSLFDDINILSNANGSVNDVCMDIETTCNSECRDTLQNVGCCYRNLAIIILLAFNVSEENIVNLTDALDRCNAPVCSEPQFGTEQPLLTTITTITTALPSSELPGLPVNSDDAALVGGTVAAALVFTLLLAAVAIGVVIIIAVTFARRRRYTIKKAKGFNNRHPNGGAVETEHEYDYIGNDDHTPPSDVVLTECPAYAINSDEETIVDQCPTYETIPAESDLATSTDNKTSEPEYVPVK